MTTAWWRHLVAASLGALAIAAIALGAALGGFAGALLAAGIVVVAALVLAHQRTLARLERAPSPGSTVSGGVAALPRAVV